MILFCLVFLVLIQNLLSRSRADNLSNPGPFLYVNQGMPLPGCIADQEPQSRVSDRLDEQDGSCKYATPGTANATSYAPGFCFVRPHHFPTYPRLPAPMPCPAPRPPSGSFAANHPV